MRLYLDLCTSSFLALQNLAGEVVAAQVFAPPLRNEDAIVTVENLLGQVGHSLQDLTAIAVAAGPGSFTGIRVGLALAQGLAFSRHLPLHAFSTLGALQAAYPHYVAALPAQGGRWYLRAPASQTDGLYSEVEAQDLVKTYGGKIALAGELPKTWMARPLFEIAARLEHETPWPQLFAYGFAQVAAPLGMVSPHYVQASAAEAKRRGSESEPIYRPWHEGDLTFIAQLEKICNADAWSEAGLLASYRGQGYAGWVAEIAGEMVGYCLVQNVLEQAEVMILGVTPERRRQGFAQGLLRHALNQLAGLGMRHVYLEVRAGNVAARALYARLGFRESGQRKGYYAAKPGLPAEDAVLMDLDLSDLNQGRLF